MHAGGLRHVRGVVISLDVAIPRLAPSGTLGSNPSRPWKVSGIFQALCPNVAL